MEKKIIHQLSDNFELNFDNRKVVFSLCERRERFVIYKLKCNKAVFYEGFQIMYQPYRYSEDGNIVYQEIYPSQDEITKGIVVVSGYDKSKVLMELVERVMFKELVPPTYPVMTFSDDRDEKIKQQEYLLTLIKPHRERYKDCFIITTEKKEKSIMTEETKKMIEQQLFDTKDFDKTLEVLESIDHTEKMDGLFANPVMKK